MVRTATINENIIIHGESFSINDGFPFEIFTDRETISTQDYTFKINFFMNSLGVQYQSYGWEVLIMDRRQAGTWTNSTTHTITTQTGLLGAFYTPNTNAWTSDDRLKINESFIENATETLMKLRPQKYKKYTSMPHEKLIEYVDISGVDISGATPSIIEETGLIAQEIWYDAPELRHLINTHNVDISAIDKPPDDYYENRDDPTKDPDYNSWGMKPAEVNYTGLIPYVVKSVQELNHRFELVETNVCEASATLGTRGSECRQRSERSMLNERILQLEADNAKLRQEMEDFKKEMRLFVQWNT